MALYVIVVSAQAVGRNQFDANLASSIVEIVNLGRPVLICINMMCEKMHWWKTADATAKACTAIKDSIVSKADRDHGPVTVFMTECLFYDDFQEQMQARQIKTVEDVSWKNVAMTECIVCRSLEYCGTDCAAQCGIDRATFPCICRETHSSTRTLAGIVKQISETVPYRREVFVPAGQRMDMSDSTRL